MADVKNLPAAGARPAVSKPVVSRHVLVKLAADVPESEKYVVRPNDTLSEIAVRHGVLLSDLLKANPELTTEARRRGNLIFPNDQVRIPAKPGWEAPGAPATKTPATLVETKQAVVQTNDNSVKTATNQLKAALLGEPNSELTGPQLATLEADLKRAADGDPPPEGLDDAQKLLTAAKEKMQAAASAGTEGKEPPELSRLVMEHHLGTALFDTLREFQAEWSAIGDSDPMTALSIARAKGQTAAPAVAAPEPAEVENQSPAKVPPEKVSDLQRLQLLGPTALEQQDTLSDIEDDAAKKLEILDNEDGKIPSEVAQDLKDHADDVRVEEEPEMPAASQESGTLQPLSLLDQAVVFGQVARGQLLALTDPNVANSLSKDPATRATQLKQLRDALAQEATALLQDPARQEEANQLRAAVLALSKTATPDEAAARVGQDPPQAPLMPAPTASRTAQPAIQSAPIAPAPLPVVSQPVAAPPSDYPSANQQLLEQQLAAMAQRPVGAGYMNYAVPGFRLAGMPYNPYGPNGLAGAAAQTYNQLLATNQMAMNQGVPVPNMMSAGGGSARQRLMAVQSGGFLVGRHPTEQVKVLTQFFLNWNSAKQAELMRDPATYDQVTSTIAYLLDAPQARGVLGSIINRPLVSTLHTYFPELLTDEKMKRL